MDKLGVKLINPLLDKSVVSAYHESGHAVMYFFFGQPGNFYSVDINPNADEGALGVLHAKGTGRMMAMTPPGNSPEEFHRFATIRSIMIDLAGMSAHHRVMDVEKPGQDWLQVEWEDPDWKDNPSFDMYWADAVAKNFHGEGRRYWGFLSRVGRWAEEVIREPRMWKVVETLAAHLLDRKRLERDEAWDIMEEAYSTSDEGPPFLATKRWRMRFLPGGKAPWAGSKYSSQS